MKIANINAALGLAQAVALCGLLCTTACGQTPPATNAATNSLALKVRGTPQPKLPGIKIYLGAKELNAEIAMTKQQIETGMMFRTNILETEAMLFVFAQPHRTAFWMKNTLIPLSCAYIDPNGVILEIKQMQPLDERPLYANSDRVQFVLETARGWFDRNKVTVGTVVTTERGTLSQTFFGK